MIKLRLVGPSDDLQHLVYSASKSGRKGSHLVQVDDDLFDVLEQMVRERRREARGERESQRPKAKAAVPRVESKLAPKDVQRLLRSGRTVDQVAKIAQVPVAWVEQFLGVVQYERIGVVNEVRRSWMEKQRLGMSGVPLGEAVEINLRARHVRLTDQDLADAWDASRTDDQPWVVSLSFRFRGRMQKATWKYDPSGRVVTPVNRLAADLGWVAPGRKIPPRTKENAVAEKSASKTKSRTRRNSATKKRKPAAKSRKPAAKKRKPAPKKRSPAKKRRTVTKKRPAAKKRARSATRSTKKSSARRAPVKKRTTSRSRGRAARRR